MVEEHIVETRNNSSWQLPAIIVLGLVAIAGLGFGWNASSKLDATQQAVTSEVKTSQQAEQQDMSSLKDRIAQDEKANSDLQGDLKVVTDKLKITQGQLKKARLATEAAAKQNDETTQKLSALDTSVHTELATKAATDDVKTVDTKVTAVSADLNTTKEDLKMAKSEMGLSSRVTMMKSTSSAVSANATTSNSPSLARTSPRRSAMSPSNSRASTRRRTR